MTGVGISLACGTVAPLAVVGADPEPDPVDGFGQPELFFEADDLRRLASLAAFRRSVAIRSTSSMGTEPGFTAGRRMRSISKVHSRLRRTHCVHGGQPEQRRLFVLQKSHACETRLRFGMSAEVSAWFG